MCDTTCIAGTNSQGRRGGLLRCSKCPRRCVINEGEPRDGWVLATSKSCRAHRERAKGGRAVELIHEFEMSRGRNDESVFVWLLACWHETNRWWIVFLS